MLIALQDSRIAATSISSIYSVVLDALTRRLVEIAIAELGEPPTPFACLALGSHARREAVPSSDVDCAIVWYGDADEQTVRPHLHEIAQARRRRLAACGEPPTSTARARRTSASSAPRSPGGASRAAG